VECGEHWDVRCQSVENTRLVPANMDPRTNALFYDWCIRISQILYTGESFKHDTFDMVPIDNDKYLLHISLWHKMPPSEKKAAIVVV
jgi:hypothetical protein